MVARLAAGLALVALAAGAVLLAVLLLPVSAPKPGLQLAPSDVSALPGWNGDAQADILPALLRSCGPLEKRADDRTLGPGAIAGTAAAWKPLCAEARRLPPGDHGAVRRFFEANFRAWAASDRGNPEGLFTGYYEAQLRGSRTADATYRVPLLRRPADLVSVDLGRFREEWRGQRVAGRVEDGRLVPYAARAEIVAGALDGRGLELVWVDDPVEAFFLQIQGSGRVALADGGEMRVGYADQNGHAYYAIGRELVKRGHLQAGQVTADAIKAWLRANPAAADEIMNTNRSYVFFRELTGDGPIGAEGVALTPGRSLAVDRAHFALGVPMWLDTTFPAEDAAEGRPLRRLMMAQDTGGAIRGPVRGDVFYGHGPQAERLASGMRQPGRYWLLLPRTVTPPGALLAP